MGKIYYIMGKSSSGKDTLFRKIKQELPMLQTVTLYTTRPKRDKFFPDEAQAQVTVTVEKSGQTVLITERIIKIHTTATDKDGNKEWSREKSYCY